MDDPDIDLDADYHGKSWWSRFEDGQRSTAPQHGSFTLAPGAKGVLVIRGFGYGPQTDYLGLVTMRVIKGEWCVSLRPPEDYVRARQ